MGKINDIIDEVRCRAAHDSSFNEELLKACDDGLVEIIYKKHHNVNIAVVYINVLGFRGYVGQYTPKVYPGNFFNNNCYIDDNIIKDYIEVPMGHDTGQKMFNTSLDELIEHGAKEIKEDV